MNYSEVEELRVQIIEGFSKVSVSPKDLAPQKKLKVVLDSLVTGEKFVTIFNFKEAKFVFLHKVEDILGYKKEEFTIEALNNSSVSDIQITSKKDIAHKLRYDLVMYKLLTKGYFLTSLEDCYEITFRVLHKTGREIVVRRSCYIYEVSSDGIPLSHIDIWEVLPNIHHDNIVVNLISRKNNKANLDFFNTNSEILGIKFTDRQLEILKYKEERKLNKEIANELKITDKTLDNHINKMIGNFNLFLMEKNIEQKIYNTSDLLYFSRMFGLYPKPVELDSESLQYSANT